MDKDELLFQWVKMSLTGTEGALDTGLLVSVGKFTGDEDLLLRNDLEGLGNKVGEGAIHHRLELTFVLLFESTFFQIHSNFSLFLVGLKDKILVTLLSLADGLIEGNDECHVNLVGLGEEEQTRDVIVLDLVVVFGTTHAEEGTVQLDGVATTGSEEGTLGFVELDNDISGRFFDVSILHDALLEQLGRRGGLTIGGIGIRIGRDVHAQGDELIRSGLDSVSLVKLQFNFISVVTGKDALTDLVQIDAHHLLAIAGLKFLSLLVSILQDALLVDEVAGSRYRRCRRSSRRTTWGCLVNLHIVQSLLEDLPDA